MRTRSHLLLRALSLLVLVSAAACSDGGAASSSSSVPGDGGVAPSSPSPAGGRQCPQGRLQLAFSDPKISVNEFCGALANVAGSTGTLIVRFREGQASESPWLQMQVDAATGKNLGIVQLSMPVDGTPTLFATACGAGKCPEVEVSDGSDFASPRQVTFRGLKLPTEGVPGLSVTLTGVLETK